MKYIKHLGKDYQTFSKVVVYSDRFSIEKAWVDNGKLLAEFSSLEDLQEFNKVRRKYPTLGVLDAVDFDTKADYYYSVLYLYDMDDYSICDDCGVPFRTDDLTTVHSGDKVCEKCLEHYCYCEHCDEYCHEDDMVEIHTDTYSRLDNPYYVCKDCADDVAYKCEKCGDWYEKSCCKEGADGCYYCEDCFDDLFEVCSDCGCVMWRDDACYSEDDDCYYCEDCYESHDVVRKYHNDPDRVYHRAEIDDPYTRLFIGTEVETEHGDREKRIAITKEYGDNEEYIYQMHDGSLESDGIECITQPMTKAFWDAFDFEGWMAELSDAGARSHDTEHCGLHVHLSREWLRTDDDDEQAVLVARMRQFIADNQQQVEKFARRSANRWCEYTKTFDKGEDRGTKEQTKDKHKKKGKDGGRYQSVNNTNYKTIEFRIFRGTLKANTYRASVEFCLRLVDYVLTKEDSTETWQDFLEYKPLPASMEQYLTERGLL